jgi:hypothetical protein
MAVNLCFVDRGRRGHIAGFAADLPAEAASEARPNGRDTSG